VGASYPERLQHISAWTQDGYIYGAGGMRKMFVGPDTWFAVPSAKTYRYDPVADAWEDAPIADLPAARYDAAVAIHDGRATLAGGVAPGLVASILSWDSERDTWIAGPSMLAARSSAKGAVLQGSLHVVGGLGLLPGGYQSTATNQRLGLGSPFAETEPTRAAGGAAVGAVRDRGASLPAETSVVLWSNGEPDSSAAWYWPKPIDLTEARTAWMMFDSWLADGSIAAVQASLDGSTWETASVIATGRSRAYVDLSAFAGQVVYVRFVLATVNSPNHPASGRWTIGDVAVVIR
jgi:hypothetical protein